MKILTLILVLFLFQTPTYDEMAHNSSAALEDSREAAIHLAGALESFRSLYVPELQALASTDEQNQEASDLSSAINDLSFQAHEMVETIREIQEGLGND